MNNNKWNRQKIRRVLTPVVWTVGLLYTVHSHQTGCPREVILGAWFIAPPVWLALENWFLFDGGKEERERFIKWQWHQRNLWLGVAAFLAVKYLPLISS